MNGRLTVVFVIALLACSGANAAGRTLYVNGRRGSDGNSGTSPDRALKTISAGARVLRGGDKLIVGPGVYYERPVFGDMGASPDKPVWILAQPRGEAVISGTWEAAAEGKIKWTPEGGGVYSTPRTNPALFCWTTEKAFVFRYMTLKDLRARKVSTRGRSGEVTGPEAGFTCEGGKIYLRLPDSKDPNGRRLMFSSPSWGEKPTEKIVQIHSPHVVFDGFRVQGTGTFGVVFYKPQATVRNCVFEYCREGVGIGDDSLVEWCEYTYPGFYDFAEETRKLNGGRLVVYPLTKDYHSRNWYEGSLAYPTAGNDEPSPRRVTVRNCYIHQVFDGLMLGGFEDSDAHHNVFEHCYDNHVELETWTRAGRMRNIRFHHNLLLSCPGGPISHQEPNHLEGPHYVYRNVVVGYDEHGLDPWVIIKSKCYGKGRGFYYYHNLFLVRSAEPYWNEKHWPQEWLKTFTFKNNVFIFTKDLKRPTGPRGTEGYFKAAANVVVAPGRANKAILDALLRNGGKHFGSVDKLRFRNADTLDFRLQPGSPLIDAGVKIPGFNDNARGTPDIGPFEAGDDAGPGWPRPRKTVFNAADPDAVTGRKSPPKIVLPVRVPEPASR